MKTITGIWVDPRGNMAAWGRLHAKLSQDAVILNSNQVAPREVEFALDQRGALRPGAKIWANDELSPSGTFYTLVVTEFGGGVIWGPANLVISGQDPIDLTALLPVSTIPPTDQAASLSVVTSPTLVAGALSGTISTPLGVSTGLVTVSDQLVLAPAGALSIIGSQNQQSLSLTLSAQALPASSTAWVTGRLSLVGGSNVVLASSSGASATTVTINAVDLGDFPGGQLGGLSLQAGSNITLSRMTDSGGNQTITINGMRTNPLLLTAGSNVSLVSSSDFNGSTVTINAVGGGTGGGAAFSAGLSGGNTQGQAGPVINQIRFAGGSNITLSGATNAAGMTVSINGASGGAGAAFSGGANGQTVSNQLMLTAGSNITLSTAVGVSGMTVTISGASGGAAGSPLWIGGGAAGGGTSGVTAQAAASTLSLYAGSNITLSMNTAANARSVTFIGPAPGAGGGGSLYAGSNVTLSTSGVSTSISVGQEIGVWADAGGTVLGETGRYVGYQLDFHAGSNITLSRNFSVAASRNDITIIGPTPGGGGGGQLSLIEGANVGITQVTSASGTVATISAAGAGAGGAIVGQLSSWNGGTVVSNVFQVNPVSTMRFQIGPNLSVSHSTSAGAPGVMAMTWGAPYAYQQSFVNGANVTINSTYATAGVSNITTGVTYTINAGGGPGGGGLSVAITGTAGLGGVNTTGAGTNSGSGPVGGNLYLGITQVSTNRFPAWSGSVSGNDMTASFVLPNKPGGVGLGAAGGSYSGVARDSGISVLSLFAGSNILLSGATAANQQTITIAAAGGGGPGGAAFTGGANGETVSNQLMLTQGANISLNTATGPTGLTVTIDGPAPGGADGGFWIANNALVGGGATAGAPGANGTWTQGVQFRAGAGIRFYAVGATTDPSGTGILEIGFNDYRSFCPAYPLMPFYTSVTGAQANQGSAVFWPFQPGGVLPGGMGASASAILFQVFSQPASGTAYGTYGCSLGMYTRQTGASSTRLNRYSSNATSYAWSYSAAVNRTNLDGMKMIRVPFPNAQIWASVDYYLAYIWSTSSSSQSFGISGVGCEFQSGDCAGELGAATAASFQRIPGWGVYSGGSILAATLAFSDIYGSAATAMRCPLVYFANLTF